MISHPGARAAFVALLAAGATLGSLRGDFVYDDQSAIVDNGIVTGRLPWTSAFRRDFWGRSPGQSTRMFRPLVTLDFRAGWWLGRGSPIPFHAANVAVHAAVCAVAYLAFRILVPESAALGGAALFAVFGGSSEAVDAIMGHADLLLALFALLGLICHVRGRFGLAALALLLATCCKESAIFAPVAWFLIGPPERRRTRAAIGYAAALAVATIARVIAIGDLHAPQVDLMRNPLRAAGPVERLFGASRIFARFTLAGFVDPGRRLYACSAPGCGPAGASDPLAWAGLLVLVALCVAPFVLWRRAPAAARGIAWFLVFFLPLSNLVIASSCVYGERLFYVPCLGLCVAIASALLAIRPPALGFAALAGLVAWNAAALQARHRDWRSETELYLSALPVAPDSAQIQANAATAWYRLHDAERAEQHARLALRLWPDYPQAEVVLALSLDRLGRPAEAEPLLAHAFQASAFDVEVASDYARFLLRQGRRSDAASVLRRAKAAWPDSTALDPLLRRFR